MLKWVSIILLVSACTISPESSASRNTAIPIPVATDIRTQLMSTPSPSIPTVAISPSTSPRVNYRTIRETISIDGYDVTILWTNTTQFPANCAPLEVAQLIAGFLNAFNAGHQHQLATFFSESAFVWYSASEGSPSHGGRHDAVFNKTDLLNYFAARHRQHEYMRLEVLEIGPHWEKDALSLAFSVIRHADDIQHTARNPDSRAHGKGAVSCKWQSISVWSMGME